MPFSWKMIKHSCEKLREHLAQHFEKKSNMCVQNLNPEQIVAVEKLKKAEKRHVWLW